MRIITFILLLGLLINGSLNAAKNTFKQTGMIKECEHSVLKISLTGDWDKSQNIPSSDFVFKLPLEDGKEASCNYLNSSKSIACQLNGGGSFEFSDYTMRVDNDEYLLQSANITDDNPKICEVEDISTQIDSTTPASSSSNSFSMIYSSLLILILLNILLF